jgi:hypothetical protein
VNAATSPLGLRAGHCTACGECLWRSARLQKDAWGLPAGQVFLLWPRPDSVYAKVETPSGYAPGIAYCRPCAPRIGEPGPILDGAPVIGYEPALERYVDWWAPDRDAFYRAYLGDALFLDAVQIEELLKLWETDRVGPSSS